jgi:homoaconitase/3-isopropylmalate dehydratase large subunit
MSFFNKIFGKKKKEEKVEVDQVVTKIPVEVVEEVASVQVDEQVKDQVIVEEPSEELVELKDEEVSTEQKVVVKEIPESLEKKETSDVLYEIRTHKDEGWQVIKKEASRARRRFDTQAECINYCKDMNYDFELFKKDGKKR